MKIIMAVLMISVSSLVLADYTDEYTENEDGTSTYVGSCTLHEDYEGVTFSSYEVIPYTDAPTMEFFNTLPEVYKKLTLAVYNEELGPYTDGPEVELEWFDDISFSTIKVYKTNQILHRVSFGVGGGNGGYHTYAVSAEGNVELMASTFDSDLLTCANEYTK